MAGVCRQHHREGSPKILIIRINPRRNKMKQRQNSERVAAEIGVIKAERWLVICGDASGAAYRKWGTSVRGSINLERSVSAPSRGECIESRPRFAQRLSAAIEAKVVILGTLLLGKNHES